MKKYLLITALFVMLAFCFVAADLSHAAKTPANNSNSKAPAKLPTAEVIWKRILACNPGLNDFQVDMTIKGKAKVAFIRDTVNIESTYYYRRPNQHKVKITKAPFYLKKYSNVFEWKLPDLNDFYSDVRMDQMDGKNYYVVTLTPKGETRNLKSEEIWVDPSRCTFPLQVFYYKNGNKITVSVSYRKVGDYILLDSMNADIDLPSDNANADAIATFGSYQINKGVPDDVFNNGR